MSYRGGGSIIGSLAGLFEFRVPTGYVSYITGVSLLDINCAAGTKAFTYAFYITASFSIYLYYKFTLAYMYSAYLTYVFLLHYYGS